MPTPEKLTNRVSQPRLKLELLIIFLVVVALSGLESSMRLIEGDLSGNLRHINQIPEIASKLGATKNTVLFLGNSLINDAVNPAFFNRTYSILNGESPRNVGKITPDGTSLSDWYCIYRNFIDTQRHPPNIVILGFAWGQLSDQYPVNPARLGGLFCSFQDLHPLDTTDLSKYENILAFTAGVVSHVYLNREAIRHRVLVSLVPNYQQVTQQLNTEPTQNFAQNIRGDESQYSYETLIRLCDLIISKDSKLLLVAMPVQNQYTLDPKLPKIAEDHGAVFLDLRNLQNIDASKFKDNIHLNESGSALFSRTLSELIDEHTVNSNN